MEECLNYNTVIAKTIRGGKNPSNKKNLVSRQERRKKGNKEQMGEGGAWVTGQEKARISQTSEVAN